MGVKCGVKECMHNNDDGCRAEAIEVKSVGSKAGCREDTCCSSFATRRK